MSHIHFGILGVGPATPPVRELPSGFFSGHDSFLEWGERDINDGTLHVVFQSLSRIDEIDRDVVSDLRYALTVSALSTGERLADYVVVTNEDDWSAGNRVFLLDGSVLHSVDCVGSGDSGTALKGSCDVCGEYFGTLTIPPHR